MPGGVCAVLDYEVEQMAEFVADMATRVVTPNVPVTSPFRKFVTQILTSTRLPKSTILLGMNYLAKRVNGMRQMANFKMSEGQAWRMLTVALLLGSKFLDDNTFQNRSWSEVSGIPVGELNVIEREWLTASNWNLYVNMDFSEDYTAWLQSWDDWKILRERATARANRERLAALVPAIETDIARMGGRITYSTWVQQQTAELERYQAHKRADMPPPYASHVDWSANIWNSAPISPPDSGYGTPEYINSATSANTRYNEWFSQATTGPQWHNRFQPTALPAPAPAHNAFYGNQRGCHPHPPSYAFSHNQAVLPHGLAECSCSSCLGAAARHQPYFHAHPHGQTVMG